ncbi:hypothetical protein [Lacticaseibacillus daqingensis]|uniref:hypothetical protein n=1 Tax=Lacticaseibacillus daqingensis TaxID=2486014 RepID=UPI000F78898F|nr:hypothetical protein [Lacticaseibacillus daqingensis]
MPTISRKDAQALAAAYVKQHHYVGARLLAGLHQGPYQNASYVFVLTKRTAQTQAEREQQGQWPYYLYVDSETGALLTRQGPWS